MTNKLVLTESVVTGHSHTLVGDFKVVKEVKNKDLTGHNYTKENKTYTVVDVKEGYLVHEEHDPIKIKDSLIVSTNQVEFDPFNKILRNILD